MHSSTCLASKGKKGTKWSMTCESMILLWYKPPITLYAPNSAIRSKSGNLVSSRHRPESMRDFSFFAISTPGKNHDIKTSRKIYATHTCTVGKKYEDSFRKIVLFHRGMVVQERYNIVKNSGWHFFNLVKNKQRLRTVFNRLFYFGSEILAQEIRLSIVDWICIYSSIYTFCVSLAVNLLTKLLSIAFWYSALATKSATKFLPVPVIQVL